MSHAIQTITNTASENNELIKTVTTVVFRSAHLRSVPDDGRSGVAELVPARAFVVVDQEEVILREKDWD